MGKTTTAGRSTENFGAGKFPNRTSPEYPDNRVGLSAPMSAGNISRMAASEEAARESSITQAVKHLNK